MQNLLFHSYFQLELSILYGAIAVADCNIQMFLRVVISTEAFYTFWKWKLGDYTVLSVGTYNYSGLTLVNCGHH